MCKMADATGVMSGSMSSRSPTVETDTISVDMSQIRSAEQQYQHEKSAGQREINIAKLVGMSGGHQRTKSTEEAAGKKRHCVFLSLVFVYDGMTLEGTIGGKMRTFSIRKVIIGGEESNAAHKEDRQ